MRKPDVKPKPSALLKLGYKDLVLDEYERECTQFVSCDMGSSRLRNSGQIASEVIHPDDIDVRFSGALSVAHFRHN